MCIKVYSCIWGGGGGRIPANTCSIIILCILMSKVISACMCLLFCTAIPTLPLTFIYTYTYDMGHNSLETIFLLFPKHCHQMLPLIFCALCLQNLVASFSRFQIELFVLFLLQVEVCTASDKPEGKKYITYL